MTGESKYVLDANVFIEAARHYYAFDLAPGFWESLVRHAEDGRVQSIDGVKQELERGKGPLADWAKSNFADAFASTDDQDVVAAYAEIMIWAQAQSQFTDAAKDEFARVADGWVVAYGKAKGRVVVTHEVPAPDARKRVKIPNVCQAFDVPFVDTFKMLRELGVQFA